ncbi:hypothetical protein [Gimesia aquarii]|uniref:Chromosome partition protein Smc n=1 Tax=Gimesia aquarii TaxID=2527964 RepID=A0A517X2V0_9PLAN|nr:hypothetical protein [Gimesia aquarii]QDU11815.1 hypothetical protein V202x_52400 [Gimesia aquarii]
MPSALSIRVSCCLILASILNGCAAVNSIALIPQRIGEKWTYRSKIAREKQLDKAAVHEAKLADLEDERVVLKISRDVLVEKRRAEREALMADARAEIEASRPEFREQLETDLGLKFNQRLNVGQLQVDLKKMEALLDDRKQEQKKLDEDYAKRLKLHRENLAKLRSGKQNLESGSEDCARPLKDKLIDKENLEAPPKLAILPTEIPLMLPVTLNVELQNPSLRQSNIKRTTVPLLECKEALEDECCKGCLDGCTQCLPTTKKKRIFGGLGQTLAPPAVYQTASEDSILGGFGSESLPPAPQSPEN